MRVLLAEIGENVQWDPAKSGSMTISNGGKTLTNATGSTTTTNAGVKLPRLRGKHYWRVRFDVVTGLMHVGIYSDPRSSTGFLGIDVDSWCYRLSGGSADMYHQNTSGGLGMTAVTAGGFVDFAVDLDAGKMWVGVNGVWQLAGDPAAGTGEVYSDLLSITRAKVARAQDRFYIGALMRTNTTSVTLITDYDSCAATCPAGFTPVGEFAYIASQGYCSTNTDAPPSRYYDGRMVDDGDPIYERAVTVAAWNRTGNTRTPLSSFDLINNDQGLGFWSRYSLRDMPIRWRVGDDAAATSTFTDAAYTIIDAVTAPDEGTLRVVQKDKFALLDRPWTNTKVSGSPVTEVNGKNFPLLLGRCFWVPFVQFDPANLNYTLADSEFGEIEEVRDQGVVITRLTGWDGGSNPNTWGVRRVTNPAGKQVATVKGAVTILGTQVGAGPGDFTSWVGGAPFGWTETSAGAAPNDVQQVGNTARFLSNGAAQVSLSIASLLFNGARHWVEVTVSARTSGRLSIEQTGTGTTVLGYCPAVGTYRFPFLPVGSQTTFQIRVPAGETADITISRVRLYSTTVVQRINAWMTELAVTRGPMLAADLDATAIAALESAASYVLCYFTTEAERISDIVAKTMDAFMGWAWVNRLGLLTVGRLQDPIGQTSVLTITDLELFGEVRYEDDTAPALSTRVSGRRNWSPHQDSEIAGSVLNTAAAAQLRQDYLATAESATAVDGAYAQARVADPTPTILAADADVQTEATRRGGLWSKPRRFYSFSAFITGGTGYTLEPGQTITLQANVYDLAAGKKLMLVYVRSRFLSDLVDFVAWG